MANPQNPADLRWADQPTGATPEELAAGELFQRAKPRPLPPEAVFAAVQRRILSAEVRSPCWSLALRLALAAVALSLASEVGLAVVRRRPDLVLWLPEMLVRGVLAPMRPQARTKLPPAVARMAEAPSAALDPPLSQPPLVLAGLPAPVPTIVPPRPSRPVPARTETAESPVDPSPLAREAAALAPVATALRQGGDGASALARLTDYRAQFPHGALSPTADLLELRAWILRGDDRLALARLDALHAGGFAGVAEAAELRVLRGELLLRDAQATSAAAAFSEALAGPLAGVLRERALFGRASALARAGDAAAAREGIAAYLTEFPGGRFAVEARRALTPAPP